MSLACPRLTLEEGGAKHATEWSMLCPRVRALVVLLVVMVKV